MEYGLIGERLGHSYSKPIHEAFGGYTYEIHAMPPSDVPTFMRTADFRGINVTIPYKKDVIPFCATISDTVRKIGSVNTVLRHADGSLHGYNTDYDGFDSMVKRGGISFEGKHVVILGTGGTSLTAQTVAKDRGAAKITVVSRRGEVNYDNLDSVRDGQILVNTTPVGMYPENGRSAVSLADFPMCEGVVDVIYNPLRTALLLDAMERGIPCADGLYMLVAQARRASELFRNVVISDGENERVYSEIRCSVENIVLIGMPGCGKSTVSAVLAEKTGREVVEFDAEIEKLAGCDIPTVFAEQDEKAFRDLETRVAETFGKEKGKILSVGGGGILRWENVRALRQNGRLYQLERDLHALDMRGRPLSKDPETLKRMQAERRPFYEKARDVAICNDETPEVAADRILADFMGGRR